MRASALAASVHSDLSTVSRQVAALVGRGLLERRADQRDGRACVLAVTEAGRAGIAEHERGRQAFFDEVLAGWSPANCGSSRSRWNGSPLPTTASTPPGWAHGPASRQPPEALPPEPHHRQTWKGSSE